MKMNSLIILLGLLLCTLSCAPWQAGAEKNVTRNGIEFESFKEEKDGSKLGILAGDTVIDGWPCKQGFIVFYPDWRPDELLLFRDYERNGIFMPAGTWVFPNEQGNPGVCMFPGDMEIQGFVCRGSRMGKEGVMTSFHTNGKLKHFFPRDRVEVDGVPCKGSIFSGVSLHDDGTLHECVLAEATTVGGVKLSRGRAIQLGRNGRLVNNTDNR